MKSRPGLIAEGMMRYATLASLFLTLIFQPSNLVIAQPQNQDKLANAALAFDLAAAGHKQGLRNLLQTRGANLVATGDKVTSKDIATTLATRSREYCREAGYPEKTAVLFYSYEKGALSVWLLDEQGIRAYEKRRISQERIERAVYELRESMGVDSLQQTRAPRPRNTKIKGQRATPKLPVKQAVANITAILIPSSVAVALAPIKHLVVVPVRELGTVPFVILQPFADDSFLIDRMSVSLAPSLFDIGQNIACWTPQFSSPLIVGNPYLPPSARWIVPPLPGAETEAQAVASALNATPLLGKEATKQSVLLKAPASDFLYFATHGIANSEDPLTGGFLMLSASELEKGWWTAREVQARESRWTNKLTAKIAVLSACQTGLGRVHDAGIIGLARAFQIAGVPRVVMSLWSINDAATSELMQAFVRNIQNNIPSEALRLAMLEVRKRRPFPSQWASFVMFGTPR